MKLSSVIKIIDAHFSGDEAQFVSAVTALADEEERKGNRSGATSLRNALAHSGAPDLALPTHKRPPVAPAQTSFAPAALAASSLTAPGPSAMSKLPPKDRDSALELFEWITPTETLDALVLPASHRKVLDGFLEEQKASSRLEELGLGASQRLLLCGPPGCGKTKTALAVAAELGIPVAYVRLDGLVSSFLGQTGANIRRIFEAVKGQRVVLFLDEIDAIAKKRDDQHELGELKRVVTTLLQNFDNLSSSVVLVAATNHPHLLDPALWRRFNVVLTLGIPDDEARKHLIEKLLDRYPTGKIKVAGLVKAMEGLSPANIEEVIKQAVKSSLVLGQRNAVRTEDLYTALIRFMGGAVMAAGEHQDDYLLAAAVSLQMKGVPVRMIADSLGIPKSTLQDALTRTKGGMKYGR